MSSNDPALLDYEPYITRLFAEENEAQVAAREAMIREGLPQIAVSPSQGQLLYVLTLIHRPKRILEIGTLGGYSATWFARALPDDGKLISLEIDPHHAEVARKNLERAGFASKTEVRVGPALQTLDQMAADNEPPFDLVFIDADKEAYPDYLKKVLPMVREGGLILADNTMRPDVLDPGSTAGIPRYNAAAAAEESLSSILVPVLRSRGVDGLLISVKRSR